MPLLGVNIDHIATVREARRTTEPDPVWAAVEAELGGADGITFHLREDRRHIRDRDAELLRKTVAVELNMEMSIDPGIVEVALALKPDQATLVPERRAEITTEGGLDVAGQREAIGRVVARLRERGITVSAFIEPREEQIKASAEIGCQAIELWTGAYAHAPEGAAREETLAVLRAAIQLGQRRGLVVHAGHGLTYRNVAAVAALPGFSEFNIGHSIVSRAVFVGMREAVRQMKELLTRYGSKE